jgi:hypothetical protein
LPAHGRRLSRRAAAREQSARRAAHALRGSPEAIATLPMISSTDDGLVKSWFPSVGVDTRGRNLREFIDAATLIWLAREAYEAARARLKLPEYPIFGYHHSDHVDSATWGVSLLLAK